jgi:hypothetical protein
MSGSKLGHVCSMGFQNLRTYLARTCVVHGAAMDSRAHDLDAPGLLPLFAARGAKLAFAER